jgi:glycosyltransferase involved in cell wall biosynthesis
MWGFLVTLSACIITYNEERNIGRCLKSLAFADQIIVVDSFSTDLTVEIARQYTSQVYSHEWLGFGPQKNLAFSKATGDWIINLDADEEITPELAAEIRKAINSPQDYTVFRIPRKNLIGNYWVKYGSCFHSPPDAHPRIFKRGCLNCGNNLVHESYHFQGKDKRLEAYMLHYSYQSFHDYSNSMDYFARLKALDLLSQTTAFLIFKFVFLPVHALLTFLSYYLMKKGFLMGWLGFQLSYKQAWYVTRKYALALWWKLTAQETAQLKKKVLDKGRC